jgi:hypothetical protein
LYETTDPAERIQIIRAFELNQLSLRYPPLVTKSLITGDTISTFKIKPTDPDFPFELESLEIKLQLPQNYPSTRNIKLFIMNLEIPKKLSNVIAKNVVKKILNTTMTLLELFDWLDRNLETFLIERDEEPEVRITFVNPDEIRPPKQNTVQSRMEYYGALDVDLEYEEEGGEDLEYNEDEREDLVRKYVTMTDLDLALIDSMNDIKMEKQDSEDHSTSENEHDVLLQDTDVKKTGTQMNLAKPNLKNVSLLRCIQLSIMAKCNRCKLDCQFKNMKPGSDSSYMSVDCKQCSTVMRCRYRADLIHENSTCLGYLDLDQCVAWDLLPSKFLSTCDNCGKEQMENQSALIQVGQIDTPSCRSCHLQMRIELEQIRFYPLTLVPEILPMKKLKFKRVLENVVKTVGLPYNGSCKHYKKSYRWFRFPCCSKLYPCDICHAEKEGNDHESEWANRIVCGFCSKEQNYTKKGCDCAKAGKTVKRGYWNGGLGTRDRVMMNRNDAKKYSGINKTASNKRSSKRK